MKKICIIFILLLLSAGCRSTHKTGAADENGFTAPTDYTLKANRKVLKELPFSDQTDFEQAQKGFIAKEKDLIVKDEKGKTVWDQSAYSFIKGDAPPSVNPSLWRQAKLNAIHGLFKVAEGVYQIRGYDFANMTIIEGETGWIIVDPLTSKATAARAMAFVEKNLGQKKISAILFTHSHVDHFGGVQGIISAEEADRQGVQVIAPEGFMAEATSENILAGPTMVRRSGFMYGKDLPVTVRGHVDSGLGKGPAYGKIGILPPTDIINKSRQDMTIDGVRFIFKNVPGSEAPAEFIFYLPEKKTLCGAELLTRQMHNIYTLRGAKVRDSLAWSNYIEEARKSFKDAEIYFGSHHWPIWGSERIQDYLTKQRDTYKYLHDQSLRLAHAGLTPKEISEEIKMPSSLSNRFSSRGYYGSVKHNAKAVYQLYYGWFDGNPANLDPLPPEESAKMYVAYMGGADALLAKATSSYEKGAYRWTAEILNHLVFAEPGNKKAKDFLAMTYDQLGYQAESGPWRDIYLTGASELRKGLPEKGINLADAKEMLRHAPLSRFFDAMAVRLNGPKADGKELTINFVFTDLKESYVIHIENSVLHYTKKPMDPDADATLKLTHDMYLDLALNIAGVKEVLFSDDIQFKGSKLKLLQFFRLLDKPDTNFNIVLP